MRRRLLFFLALLFLGGLVSACSRRTEPELALVVTSAAPSSEATLPRHQGVYTTPQTANPQTPVLSTLQPSSAVTDNLPFATETASPTPTGSFPYSIKSATATFLSPGLTGTATLTVTPTQTVTPTITLTTPSASGCGAVSNPAFESAVLDLINQERANRNFPPLALSTSLSQAARRHSNDMACHSIYDHIGSDGSQATDRVSQSGYTFSRVAEIIFAGKGVNNDPASAFSVWMSGPTSRSYILDGNFLDVGIGYMFLESSAYGGYFTVVFAQP